MRFRSGAASYSFTLTILCDMEAGYPVPHRRPFGDFPASRDASGGCFLLSHGSDLATGSLSKRLWPVKRHADQGFPSCYDSQPSADGPCSVHSSEAVKGQTRLVWKAPMWRNGCTPRFVSEPAHKETCQISSMGGCGNCTGSKPSFDKGCPVGKPSARATSGNHLPTLAPSPRRIQPKRQARQCLTKCCGGVKVEELGSTNCGHLTVPSISKGTHGPE